MKWLKNLLCVFLISMMDPQVTWLGHVLGTWSPERWHIARYWNHATASYCAYSNLDVHLDVSRRFAHVHCSLETDRNFVLGNVKDERILHVSNELIHLRGTFVRMYSEMGAEVIQNIGKWIPVTFTTHVEDARQSKNTQWLRQLQCSDTRMRHGICEH